METIEYVLRYVFGPWIPMMSVITVFMVVNLGWDFYDKGFYPKKIFSSTSKRLGLYVTFFAIAHQLDLLVDGSSLGFDDATRFFVAIYGMMRELRYFFEILNRYGIDIPFILLSRLKLLDDTMAGAVDPAVVEQRLEELHKNIEELRRLQGTDQQENADALEMKIEQFEEEYKEEES